MDSHFYVWGCACVGVRGVQYTGEKFISRRGGVGEMVNSKG